MQNLAGREDCDIFIECELVRTGIQVVRGARNGHEVNASITGKLGRFSFSRAWYYYIAVGDMPIGIARQLYADPVGQTDIRVSGHCGCPSPDDGRWAKWKMDGKVVLPMSEKARGKEFLGSGVLKQSDMDKFSFSDSPASLGAKQYVTLYHIDSELGLFKLAEAIKRYKLG
jgi:hypothetical protein